MTQLNILITNACLTKKLFYNNTFLERERENEENLSHKEEGRRTI